MRVRDDDDLAVTQLPARAAPGRADDPQLRDAARKDPFAVPFRRRERRGSSASRATRRVALHEMRAWPEVA